MNSNRASILFVLLLLVACAGTAAWLDRWFMCWPGNRAGDYNPAHFLIGDAQTILAGHFYRKADVYFHSGAYPTIFDNNEPFKTAHMAEDSGTTRSKNAGNEESFLGRPLDIIDQFSRHMFPSRHTHLDEGGAAGDLGDKSAVREILPWLKLSQELDPEEPLTYSVAAYWLRVRMNKPREAEWVIREGLEHLPNNPTLLFELGRIYFSFDGGTVQCNSPEDLNRARNIWHRAAAEWQRQEGSKPHPDTFILEQIVTHLARLEQEAGNVPLAIRYWEKLRAIAPDREGIPERIRDLRQKQKAAKTSR